jgi:hypothetical protein
MNPPFVLEFQLRRSYGKNRYYPVGVHSSVIVSLTGRKCLNEAELKRLTFAGFAVRLLALSAEEDAGPKEEV